MDVQGSNACFDFTATQEWVTVSSILVRPGVCLSITALPAAHYPDATHM